MIFSQLDFLHTLRIFVHTDVDLYITERSSTIRSNSLSQDGKIAVASSVTVFVVASILFYIAGFLSGHFRICRRRNKTETVSQSEKTQGTPYYDDVVLKQEQELELKENVAYGPRR